MESFGFTSRRNQPALHDMLQDVPPVRQGRVSHDSTDEFQEFLDDLKDLFMSYLKTMRTYFNMLTHALESREIDQAMHGVPVFSAGVQCPDDEAVHQQHPGNGCLVADQSVAANDDFKY